MDVEFTSTTDRDNFVMPDFCLVNVTQAKFIAGGMLCGKTYADIEAELNRFSYIKFLAG